MAAAHERDERRPYSIACSPERVVETGRIELLVALEPGSEPGSHLSDAQVGGLIDVEGPLGQFTFPEEPRHQRVLFVAGGTGIAPVRAMLDHALRRDHAPLISLLYSARRSDEFAFIDEMRTYARRGLLELHQTVTRDDNTGWEGARGRISGELLKKALTSTDSICLICGPPLFVSDARALLAQLGVPGDQILIEKY